MRSQSSQFEQDPLVSLSDFSSTSQFRLSTSSPNSPLDNQSKPNESTFNPSSSSSASSSNIQTNQTKTYQPPQHHISQTNDENSSSSSNNSGPPPPPPPPPPQITINSQSSLDDDDDDSHTLPILSPTSPTSPRGDLLRDIQKSDNKQQLRKVPDDQKRISSFDTPTTSNEMSELFNQISGLRNRLGYGKGGEHPEDDDQNGKDDDGWQSE